MTDALGQLRRLAASFSGHRKADDERALLRVAGALGPVAVPTCLRQLRSADPAARQWARSLLAAIAAVAADHRDRVVRGTRELLTGDAGDEAKVDALGLLAELGETSAPTRFSDPEAIQRRSVSQLAAHLGSPAEIASAADLLLAQLPDDELLEIVDSLADTAPAGAARLVDELVVRVDVDAGLRSELRRIGAALATPVGDAPLVLDEPGRPSLLALLRAPDGRAVVVVARRVIGERERERGRARARRWRGLSVMIDERGVLADAVYDDDAPPRRLTHDIVEPLRRDGYAEAPAALAAVRRLVGEAARRAAADGHLPGAYYLGRDLLGLGDVHVAQRTAPDEQATLLGRAVDLLASGEAERARPLLERCAGRTPDDAEVASSLGLCLLALGDAAGAATWLDRAVARDPGWPLHHWNAAAAAHRAGHMSACYLALCAFLDASRTAAARVRAGRDDGDDARIDVATRFVADYERMCRLDGVAPPARPRRVTSKAARQARAPRARSRPRPAPART